MRRKAVVLDYASVGEAKVLISQACGPFLPILHELSYTSIKELAHGHFRRQGLHLCGVPARDFCHGFIA